MTTSVKPHVLIVEDEAVASMLLKKQIERMGYVVDDVVVTGESAVESAKKHDIDVVLMDIRLKGAMDGIQAAQGIRNLKNVPVIFLTGYQDEEMLSRALLVDPIAYLVKPIRADHLAATLASIPPKQH